MEPFYRYTMGPNATNRTKTNDKNPSFNLFRRCCRDRTHNPDDAVICIDLNDVTIL